MEFKHSNVKTAIYSFIAVSTLMFSTPVFSLSTEVSKSETMLNNTGEMDRLPLKRIERTVTDLEIRMVVRDHTKDKIIKIYRTPKGKFNNCSRVKLVDKSGRIYNILVGCGR